MLDAYTVGGRGVVCVGMGENMGEWCAWVTLLCR